MLLCIVFVDFLAFLGKFVSTCAREYIDTPLHFRGFETLSRGTFVLVCLVPCWSYSYSSFSYFSSLFINVSLSFSSFLSHSCLSCFSADLILLILSLPILFHLIFSFMILTSRPFPPYLFPPNFLSFLASELSLLILFRLTSQCQIFLFEIVSSPKSSSSWFSLSKFSSSSPPPSGHLPPSAPPFSPRCFPDLIPSSTTHLFEAVIIFHKFGSLTPRRLW